MLPLKKNPVKGICTTLNCRHRVRGNIKQCSTCRAKEWRLADPVRACFQAHKDNAKRRNIESTLTLEDFREFCVRTKYMTGKGRFKHSFHIDRIIEEEGYHVWNIQKLKNYKNIKKFLHYQWSEREKKMIAHLTISKR